MIVNRPSDPGIQQGIAAVIVATCALALGSELIEHWPSWTPLIAIGAILVFAGMVGFICSREL